MRLGPPSVKNRNCQVKHVGHVPGVALQHQPDQRHLHPEGEDPGGAHRRQHAGDDPADVRGQHGPQSMLVNTVE